MADQDVTQVGIVNLHLINGMEVIGKTTRIVDKGEARTYYIVENPLIPQMRVDGGKLAITLLPFRPYSKADVLYLNPDHVMFVLDVQEQMKSAYQAQTSDIVLAPATALSNITLTD